MSSARMTLAAVVLVVVLSAPALAQRTGPPPPEIHLGVSLFTPPLVIGPGGAFFEFLFPAGWCQVVNVSATELLVSVRIFDITGTEIGLPGDGSDPSRCTAAQLLQPKTGCFVPTGHDFVGFAYCKITVVGAKESARGSLVDGADGVNFANRGAVAAQ